MLDKLPAGRSERIDLVVQRDLTRRRRLLLVYLILLLIPLGIGGWFLAAGRSDQEAVQQIIQQRMAPVERSYRELTPQLEQVKDLDRVLPEVKSAAREIAAQKVQVEKLAQGQAMIQRQVLDVSSNIRALNQMSMMASSEDPTPDYDFLKARLDRLEQNVNAFREAQTVLADQQKLVAIRLEQLQKEKPISSADLKRLEARLSSIEKSQTQMKEEVIKRWTLEKPPR
jgi:chromosome segregation ATPase